MAAVTNALLVQLSPIAFLVIGSLASHSDTSVTVRPPGAPYLVPAITELLQVELILLPFAALAGWRTWVYARLWRAQQATGWQGVAESGACGLAVALVYLAPGIVTRPADAPPYVIAYGGGALILGLVVGVALRTTALVVLRYHKPAAGS